ncbi:MAG: stage II sporulation protein R [Ruminococcaceae bacterium]|nr:stage II sporulation protein R [Oscillospiraceae bacterium]
MKGRILSLALALAVSLSILVGSVQLSRDAKLTEQVVRLHVIAASDSAEDQRLKLIVRDAILKRVNAMSFGSTEDAVQRLGASLDELARTAQQALQQEGIRDKVEVRLCTEQYPVRHYGTFSLPAGEYVSLQIQLGEAEGKNWWCVVYPGLCHACDEGLFEEAAEAAGFSDGQIRLMTLDNKPVQFRFKLLELLQKIKNFF